LLLLIQANQSYTWECPNFSPRVLRNTNLRLMEMKKIEIARIARIASAL